MTFGQNFKKTHIYIKSKNEKKYILKLRNISKIKSLSKDDTDTQIKYWENAYNSQKEKVTQKKSNTSRDTISYKTCLP